MESHPVTRSRPGGWVTEGRDFGQRGGNVKTREGNEKSPQNVSLAGHFEGVSKGT